MNEYQQAVLARLDRIAVTLDRLLFRPPESKPYHRAAPRAMLSTAAHPTSARAGGKRHRGGPLTG